MADCPFCARVAAGEYDRTCSTPNVVVFEPLNPVTPGHLLIVPRAHVDDATEDPVLTGLVFEWAAELAARSVHAVNLITSIGKDATQSVFHLHVHLVPRYADDGLALPWTGQQRRENGDA
jgi:histidine triad (HIT) family protein